MRYDKNYRLRAIEYWADGHTKNETAEIFKVNPATLYRWRVLLNKNGSVETKKTVRPWIKVNPERLSQLLEEHPDAYLKELAEKFGCSDVAVLKALRRLKISRKKNRNIQRSE